MDFKFLCPLCGQKLRAEVEWAGLDVNCLHCNRPIVVPKPEVFVPPPPPEPQTHMPYAGTLVPTPPNPNGAFKCPACWERFDTGDVLHIAAHDTLRGANGIGPDVPNRFYATQFDAQGRAIDPCGVPTTDIACPHCLRQLPQQFLEIPHHIISIVGDQRAGKSYYLAALIQGLLDMMPRDFGMNFRDSDPTGNAPLNEMRKSLFRASKPSDTKLAKTEFEGAMYVRLRLHGRMVMLPCPFVFLLASEEQQDQRCGIIFYDNAGEHFQPGINVVERPGAQHVASAGGILFLFDPFNSPEFHRRLKGTADPQIEQDAANQQDIIIAEMGKRIHDRRNLSPGEKIKTPLAFVVGKCDAWLHLLGPEPLLPVVKDGRIDTGAIEANSERIRSLLRSIFPAVVSHAEVISQNVTFFAASSFGHTPVKLPTGECVPDPNRLKPQGIEAPILWMLSQIQDNPINSLLASARE